MNGLEKIVDVKKIILNKLELVDHALMELKQILLELHAFVKITNISLISIDSHVLNAHHSQHQVLISLISSASQDIRKKENRVLTHAQKEPHLIHLDIVSAVEDFILKEKFARNQLPAHQDQPGMPIP